MLGYLHKDQGQPHFKNFGHNIDADEIAQGIADWSAAKLSYEDGKIAITKQNFMLRVWTFATTHCPDFDGSFMDIVTRMLNSKKYVVSAGMLMQNNVYNHAACTVQWKLINGKSVTKSEAELMLFPPRFQAARPGAAVPGQRYYDKMSESSSGASTPVRATSPDIQCSEGALATDNPNGPSPRANPANFSSMTNMLYRRGKDNADAGCSTDPLPDLSSDAVRPDSPVSVDSGEHESDAGFINDLNDSASDSDDSEPLEPAMPAV